MARSGADRRRASRPRRPARTACRWPASSALVVGVERQHDEHRSEDLVLDDLGVLRPRRRPASARSRTPRARSPPATCPPRDDLGAVRRAPGRRSRRPAPAARADTSGPWSVAGSRGSPSRTVAHQVGHTGDEVVEQRALHVGAGRRRAVLAGVDQRAGDRAVHGGLEVGVVEHDERRLAAELEVHPLDGRARRAP